MRHGLPSLAPFSFLKSACIAGASNRRPSLNSLDKCLRPPFAHVGVRRRCPLRPSAHRWHLIYRVLPACWEDLCAVYGLSAAADL